MSDNILVGVRVRPLISREVVDSSSLHWRVGDDNTITNIEPGSSKNLSAPYTFDRIFNSDLKNEDIYREVAEPIVESALAGINGTIFAYGQTSSGKTFTMMGDSSSPGIIPLTISHIFQSIENSPGREFLLRVSFMEIYNETITDLISGKPSNNSKGLSVREDGSGQIYVADLSEKVCNNEETLLSLMSQGNKYRTVASTNMNDRSSRSHTIFRLILESRECSDSDDADAAVVVSHLNLVDLAGSENASQTGATGERLKEGGFINRSLLMLGRVISQLSEGEQYINYRDSKLTRILQSSLGGNAKTAIICTVTPASVDQTHSTLRFASSAKSIKNKPIVNEVLSDAALLKRYTKEIHVLKKQLDKERNTDKAQEVEQVRERLDEEAKKNQELEEHINALKEKLVVSRNLPVRPQNDKIKKLRRETWAAPRAGRPLNIPLTPESPLRPINLTHQFIRPDLPPWSDRCRRSTPNPATSDGSASPAGVLNFSYSSSSNSFMFADDPESMLNSIEEERLERLSDDTRALSTPTKPEPKRRKKSQEPHLEMCSVECQTDESLLPKINLLSSPRGFHSPSRNRSSPVLGSPVLRSPTPGSPAFSSCSSPGTTPKHELRSKNKDLQEQLKERDEWLDNWKLEIDELREYQNNEIKILEENFTAKLEDGPMDEEKITAFNKEISSLHKSQHDSETLLMDANKELAARGQQVFMLQMELSDMGVNHIEAEGLQEELSELQENHKQLQAEMCKKNEKLNQLENERGDFDMMMELALQKQKQIEADLRRSLDEAWGEIAVFEGGNKEDIAQRSNCILDLKKELDLLKEKASDDSSEKVLNLEILLIESQNKYDQTSSELELQELKLSQETSSKEDLQSSNTELRSTIQSLQLTLDQRELKGAAETSTTRAYEDRITSLQQEVNFLRKKLSENHCSNRSALVPGSSINQSIVEASIILKPAGELTKKLSETLQVLEASICVQDNNATMGTMESPLTHNDLIQIKEQLMILQDALVMQDAALQNHEATEKKMRWKIEYLSQTLINNQLLSENEGEVSVYHMFECISQDYFMSEGRSTLPKARIVVDTGAISQTNEELIENSVKESLTELKNELEILREEKASLETRLQQNTFIEGDTLYMPRRSVAPIFRPSMNFTFSDTLLSGSSNNTAVAPTPSKYSDAMDSSLLQLDAYDQREENVKELRLQLEILNSENVMLSQKITQLQELTSSEDSSEKLEILIKEKEAMELKLKENNISYEDLQSLRWQVDSLKEEKDGLVIDLRESQNKLIDLEKATIDENSSTPLCEEVGEIKLDGHENLSNLDEVKALKDQLDLVSKENENLTQKLNDLECNKHDETHNSEIEQLIMKFTEKEEAFEETIETLKDKIQGKDEMISSLENDNFKQSEDLEKVEIQKELDTAVRKCKEFETALDNKCITLQNIQEQSTQFEASVNTQEKSLEEKEVLLSNLELEMKSLKKELDTKVINAENQLEDIRRKYQDSENEKEKLIQSNSDFESHLKKMNEDNLKLSSDIKDQSSDHLEKLNFLSATPSRTSHAHEDSQIQVLMAQKMDEYEKLKDDHTAILKEQKELKNNYENLKTLFDKKLEELKQVRLECEEQVNRYSQDILQKEEEFKENEKVINENKDKLESLHMAIQAKDHKIQKLQNELEGLKGQIGEINHDLQQSMDSAENVNSARIEELVNENKRVENMYEEVCEARKMMSDAIKAKEEQIIRLTSQLAEDKITIDQLRYCGQKETPSNDAVKNLGELNYQVDSLNVQLECLEKSLQEKEKEIIVVRNENSEVITKLEKENQNVNLKDDEIKESLNEILKLKDTICHYESKQDINSGVLNKNMKELVEKDNQIQHLMEEIDEKNKCLDEADMKLSQSESLNEDFVLKMKHMKEISGQREQQKSSSEQNLLNEKDNMEDNKYITMIEEMKVKVEELEDKLSDSTKTAKDLQEKLADKEKVYDSLQESTEALTRKLKEYKMELEFIKESDGNEQGTVDKLEDILVQKNQLENELSSSNKRFEALADEHSDWKCSYTKLFEEKEKLVAQLKHRSIMPTSPKGTLVSTNMGDVFVKDLGDANIVKQLAQQHQELSDTQEEHHRQLQHTNNLSRECNKLKDEKLKLEKILKNHKESALEVSHDEDSLHHKYLAVQRDNEELNMRIRALDAPSKKEAQNLKQELDMANNKLVYTRNELRRLQNSQVMDSTVNEIQNIKKETVQVDYCSGSSVVQEVNVLGLQNQLYHLQKQKEGVDAEVSALTQHLEHYKKKAQEWKDSATKEKKVIEKQKREVDHFQKENSDLRNKLEESNNQLEKKAFELGNQNEIVEKLQKDKNMKMSGNDKSNITTRRTRSSIARKQSDIHCLAEEAAEDLSLLETPSKQSKDPDVNEDSRSISNSKTGASQDPQQQGGKVPMWKMMGKENKDYSKYYDSPGCKKSEDDCKTQ